MHLNIYPVAIFCIVICSNYMKSVWVTWTAAVGMMYLNGQGCDRDEEMGLDWLKKSAEGDCAYGTGLLALHYYSRKLFSKAAETAFRYVYTYAYAYVCMYLCSTALLYQFRHLKLVSVVLCPG